MSKTTTTKASDSVQLTKAINTLVKTQDKLGKDIESLQSLISEQFDDIELRLTNKRKALGDLDEEYDRQLKNRKIEVDQAIKVYQYQEASKILQDKNEVAVDASTYHSLIDEVKFLKEDAKNSVDTVIKREKEKAAKNLARELKTKDLENQANQAQAEAELQQKQKEVQVLERQIKNLQEDLEKQRKLTEAVANAAARASIPQPMYAQQSQGR